MNREDIIRMAREAGFVDYELDDGSTDAFDIRYIRFAILVANAEREECAKVAEKYGYDHFCGRFTDPIATAIRARGQA